MITFIVGIGIFLMYLFTVFGVIFIDIYPILKLKSKEKVNIDMVKFDKCILPYKSELQINL